MNEQELIDEQIRYYRKRAPEYDRTATPPNDPFATERRRLEAALSRFRPKGRVLELACGTGRWTLNLVSHSAEVTALDSSLEMLALNRQTVADSRVRYIEADVFSWEPDATYDVVFFANWLSHVPPTRFDDFWLVVRRALAPEGRVFLVDEAEDAWRHEHLDEDWIDHQAVPLVRRTLLDGSTYRVIKVFWNPDDLVSRLDRLGWDISVHTTGAFYWAEGALRRG